MHAWWHVPHVSKQHMTWLTKYILNMHFFTWWLKELPTRRHTHTYIHAYMHTCTQTCMHIHTHTCIHATETPSQKHTFTYMHVYTPHTHIHMHVHKTAHYVQIHARTHSYAYIYITETGLKQMPGPHVISQPVSVASVGGMTARPHSKTIQIFACTNSYAYIHYRNWPKTDVRSLCNIHSGFHDCSQQDCLWKSRPWG